MEHKVRKLVIGAFVTESRPHGTSLTVVILANFTAILFVLQIRQGLFLLPRRRLLENPVEYV